jgi:hypothetical protein
VWSTLGFVLGTSGTCAVLYTLCYRRLRKIESMVMRDGPEFNENRASLLVLGRGLLLSGMIVFW